MIYTYHEKVENGVKTVTIHGRPETLAMAAQHLAINFRYAELYIGEDCIILRERCEEADG
jgi:hypothetical protein